MRDHIFVSYTHEIHGLTGVVLIRTDRKGKVLAAYSSDVDDSGQDVSKATGSVLAAIKGIILDRRFGKHFVIVTNQQGDFAEFFPCFDKTQVLDILQLAWPLCYTNQVQGGSFEDLCCHFGVDIGEDIADECQALVRVYWDLMKRYNTSLTAEEVARGLGGTPLQKIRGLLNF